MNKFEANFSFGTAAENAISTWMRARGNAVFPVYEKIIDEGKGPRVFFPKSEYVAPDLLVFNTEKATWIEAKHKTAFSWHRLTHRWVTGIDLKHYEHYLQIAARTPWPVWLLFLHDGGRAKDSLLLLATIEEIKGI